MSALLLPAASLWWRECIRFYRDRARAASSLATALLFWVVIGFGLAGSFAPAGMPAGIGAIEYLYPGTVVFVVLLTAILGTFSLIEDRRAGFLQGVIVAPVPRSAIVLGKVLGGSTMAVAQGALLLPLALLVGIPLDPRGAVLGLAALFGLAFALTSLGFILAWRMESIHGFHGIVNLLLMPMWLLSGALFPVAGAAGGLQLVMRLNPITYGLAAFRGALYGAPGLEPVGAGTAWAVTVGFALALFLAAVLLARR
ncbi:MAG TPA: ABC transporter permease [Gemmatimonadota bacterium]|nr:ABC transporter permease [Gemmatimonadota bacterium]